ncbi:(d)CMP kinase [Propylenella binzhouense]|uniref:Cytidylate kinase n=1 Tax=Propylenella binzhouense TaxID=2555902 RepID=A0A964WUA0_9HYPH|nr:(d)CMP kinase [Propylenella binzhouense]MYZ48635.1 (d)CMP kinase [Propylenella binzhouense]
MAPFVIAIDGPAASGKGTLARRLARHYAVRHLDTGLTYRAVADALLAAGADLSDEERAVAAARAIRFDALDRERLSREELGEAASRVAVLPRLRTALVELQRAFANEEPGAVLDGRDIGTVVCPDAVAKIYVTASPEVRARRRTLELKSRNAAAEEGEVLADLRRRDARDMARADSPLRPAEDAYLLDTTDLDIDTAFRAAVDYVERARRSRH